MSRIEFRYDNRERSIKDTIITEFAKPHTFAKTKGIIEIKESQLPVADYIIILNNKIVAAIERKTLRDYAASFKDGRHANKAKLINLRNRCNCRIYYVVEGAANPEYETEYAGIKYQNILASTHDLMINDDIHVIRTVDAVHTMKSLKMLCESYLRVSSDATKVVNGPLITTSEPLVETKSEEFSGDPVDSTEDRAEITYEETLTKANFTPEEKLRMNRVDAWSTIKGVGLSTAATVANKFTLSDWITGKLNADEVANFTFNGRRNNKLTSALSLKPNLEMQTAILAAMNGYTEKSASELMSQYSLDDLLNDRDYSHVRLGARKTRLTADRVLKIKNYLSELN